LLFLYRQRSEERQPVVTRYIHAAKHSIFECWFECARRYRRGCGGFTWLSPTSFLGKMPSEPEAQESRKRYWERDCITVGNFPYPFLGFWFSPDLCVAKTSPGRRPKTKVSWVAASTAQTKPNNTKPSM